jgi:predicted RNA binding protein YcfA (HicA-like mRNA interferase family)
MKRVDLIRHIEARGCGFLREGGRHTVYVNPTARKVSTVPRHREINEFMAKKICRELEIDEPGKEKKPAKGEQSDTADSR